jgi:hypothetical protein
MNKKDLDRFARVEQQIIDQGVTHRISELTDFPYKSLDELKSAHKNKDISFGSNYNGDFISVIGSSGENVAHAVWVSLPIIIVVADIVLAIVFKQWILLLGILFALIGFLSSSPFSPMKNIVSGLGGIMFVASFFFFDWTWSVIIGSLLFSQIFTLTAREQYRTVVEERALQSEVFFCYMLKNKHILVKDSKKNRTYSGD